MREREMEKLELVFIPSWGIGHLISGVETAKRILSAAGDRRLSATVLVISAPSPTPGSTAATLAYIQSVPDIQFEHLPAVDPPLHAQSDGAEAFISLHIQSHLPHVRSALSRRLPVAAAVIDFFATPMLDVAAELGIPAYLYYASGAAMLALHLHLPALHRRIPLEFKELDSPIEIPGIVSLIPPLSMPNPIMNKKKGSYDWFVDHGRRFREFHGLIVNTFAELEPSALAAIADGRCVPDHPTPPVYPVGPVVALHPPVRRSKCMEWLDGQPAGSVVLLCFGSKGSFDAAQAKEVAVGLERSGHRFLWCLRLRPEMESASSALPEGFQERTKGRGMVWGEWAPQAEILAHGAVGGFVTHCGWNSCLESLWFGVPMVALPLYAEQHFNAAVMEKDMGVAVVGLGVERRRGGLVCAEEVERAVTMLMGDGEEGRRVRARLTDMKKASRAAVAERGSSSITLNRLVEEISGRAPAH